jgi:hypothetical protein
VEGHGEPAAVVGDDLRARDAAGAGGELFAAGDPCLRRHHLLAGEQLAAERQHRNAALALAQLVLARVGRCGRDHAHLVQPLLGAGARGAGRRRSRGGRAGRRNGAPAPG